MTSFISTQILEGLGKGFAITGLALSMPFCFAFRSYLRFLDHLQLFFAYSIVLSLGLNLFSNNLSYSWVQFPHNIFFFCTTGQLVCTAGFPLSFGSCLLVFLVIMRLIVAIETCRKKQIRFEPVYTFFKGLTRWVYAPLCYYSVFFLVSSISGTSSSLFAAIGILAICVIFPIAQLIGYKIIQEEKDNIWRKWLQFFNFYRLLLICGLIAIGNNLGNNIPYYVVYGVYAFYAIIFTIKNDFHFKIVGRIVFVIGQVLMITCYSFFLFKTDLFINYSLDFLCIAALLLLDLVYYIAQLISYYRNGTPDETGSQKVAPQPTQDRPKKTKKKTNSYDVDLNDVDNQFNNSKQEIYTKQVDSPYLKGKSPSKPKGRK